MKESQYIGKYLRLNGERGIGKGMTIGTFLNRELMGRAKDYAMSYHRALKKACQRRVATGEAVLAPSCMDREAYYPARTL